MYTATIVGNVLSAQTTLTAGTDHQVFCYDEQNRLVWASSQTINGGPTCVAINTAGTLTEQGALYTANYAYDAQDRLTSAPLGGYSYCQVTHLHAAMSVGAPLSPIYTASYDAAGDMVCRAPTSAATCSGNPTTGQQLGYDNERRLTSWQNAPSSPTTTAAYAYDGEGNRVAQKVTASGTTTTTTTRYLAGGLEDVTISGSTVTLVKYEHVLGLCSVVIVGSGPSEAVSYLATDGLGPASQARMAAACTA